MTIDVKEDGVKVDNDDDMTVGNMYLANNTITVTAGMMPFTLLAT